APTPPTPPATPAPTATPAPAPTPSFVANVAATSGSTTTVTPTGFVLAPGAGSQFTLYWQMRMFFANGGGNCYIVSAGSYWADQFPLVATTPAAAWQTNTIGLGDTTNPGKGGLNVGLQAAGYARGPTMTVIPEACQLPPVTAAGVTTYPDYATLIGNMLTQASSLQDRVAILDLPGCLTASTKDALLACQSNLSTALAPYIASLSYGAAYGPAVRASIISKTDILYTNLQSADNTVINNLLTTQAIALYATPVTDPANPPAKTASQIAVQQAIAAAFPLATPGTSDADNTATASSFPGTVPSGDAASQLALNNLLLTALPLYAQIEQQVADQMNIMAPSGSIAGVWNKSDVQSGVWNAPANIALASVVAPLYDMNDVEQGGFNVPTNGQAIDIIRAQPGRGNVVWGARTLDGNSQDYRYIQVRRTLVYVEQTIKLALQSYVFAANDALTWTNVTSSISAFLTGLWQQGGLMGAKSSDAFTVNCGLGSTMTSQDVLNGYMVVAVTLQMIHPAEFIELTFTQTMGS
ncbi:phage tail sheath C-terminal domain-containing protein, partial [Sphingomonas sp. AR_OL41]|uniref:phage tail sheath family protein n=1 Tax=Sphingomonas sp. AR_OL41 TaxID=3042729 RepID=UPI002480D577